MTATRAKDEGSPPPIRVGVQAIIYSDTLAPEEITSRLDLQPTRTAEKGVKYGKRTGLPMNIPNHMWQLSSESHVAALDLICHLDWMLSKLYPIRERLRALRDSGEIRCVLVGVVWTAGTSAHIPLPTRLMEMLVALDLQLELEFADYGEDD